MAETIAVIILTFNEELHIARAIASVKSFATTIHVVDSNSTDRTIEIARSLGAETRTHPFINQADQFQWAVETLPAGADWVLRLDADEVIEPDLAAEIAARLRTLPADVTGVNFDRKHIFMGRWIRHGGRYPLTLLRLYRSGKAHIEPRWMDEHIVLDEGLAITFAGGFRDENLNDRAWFIAKHRAYATREAVAVTGERHGLFPSRPTGRVGSEQLSRKRSLKSIYNRLPYPIASTLYFLLRYFVQLGFLDGWAGLNYHFLQGYWYRWIAGAKTAELEAAIADCPDNPSRIARLRELTGLKLEG
ncbi:MAG: glycosyltransferase family 2 protein [Devosia sp.]